MARLLPPERDIGVLQAPVRSCLALTGIFLIVLLAMGLLERIGIDPGAALSGVVGAAFALFLLAALLSHSRRASDFYVADRKIAGAFGGLASAGAIGGLIVIGLLGGAYGSYAEFLVGAAGLTLGYLVVAALIAPVLSGFGAYTTGDFFAMRFGGVWARLAWAAIAFSVSFLLLLATIKTAGPLIEMLVHITPERALYAASGLTLVATLPGGMRSLTWTQAIQYFVIALACLVPVGFLAVGDPTAERAMTRDFNALLTANIPSLGSVATMQAILPLLLTAIGAASLPHLLTRTLTTRSRLDASASMVWGALLSTFLAAAGFMLAELLQAASGAPLPAGGGIAGFAAMLSPLPAVLAGLLLAGVLAALLSIGQAALFSAATALSHDVFDEIVDRKGPEGRRIFVARVVLIGVAAGAGAFPLQLQAGGPALVQWALALAAAGVFAPLMLGLLWRRCNEIGALGGMAAGFGFTGLIFLLSQNILPAAIVSSDWAGVGPSAAAGIGLAAAALVTIGLSVLTPAPESEVQEIVASAAEGHGRPPIHERPA